MPRDTIAAPTWASAAPQIETSTLVDSTALDVLDVDMTQTPAEAARRLTEALTATADRVQKEQHSSGHFLQMS